MSKNKKTPPSPSQVVELIFRDAKSSTPLLSAGRRPSPNDKDPDSLFFIGYRADGSSAESSMLLDEAEDYLDAVITLVSDGEARPFSGFFAVDTRTGKNGAKFVIEIADADDHTANVILTPARGEPLTFTADREPFERFLFAVREGICEDLEDDD